MRNSPSKALLRALLLLGLASPVVLAFAAPPVRHQPAAGQSAVEEATPDCDSPNLDGEPAQQRASHLAALGVDRWHAAGTRGKGVKVAVLDSGFRGYSDHLGKALPTRVQTGVFRRDGNLEAKDSQHGILCGEVVHSIAPESDILLSTWEPDDPEQFLKAVRWARKQGAKVITCSVIMPSWSDGDGGGQLHSDLADALGDALFFASAGNTARRHWTGTYREASDGFHEWEAGETGNIVKPWSAGDRVSVEMYWKPGSRYTLTVDDLTSKAEIGRSTGRYSPTRCCAVVRFQPEAGHRYCARVHLADGPAKEFHVVALGGDLGTVTPEGSIAFPADGPEVLAVGAVDHDDRRASYSSCGPISSKPKPDLVAPVPFPSLFRERAFTGTSAASPQAAALAALIWSRFPDWTANQVRDALRRSARDIGAPGHDWETGFGVATLPTLDGAVRPARGEASRSNSQ